MFLDNFDLGVGKVDIYVVEFTPSFSQFSQAVAYTDKQGGGSVGPSASNYNPYPVLQRGGVALAPIEMVTALYNKQALGLLKPFCELAGIGWIGSSSTIPDHPNILKGLKFSDGSVFTSSKDGSSWPYLLVAPAPG